VRGRGLVVSKVRGDKATNPRVSPRLMEFEAGAKDGQPPIAGRVPWAGHHRAAVTRLAAGAAALTVAGVLCAHSAAEGTGVALLQVTAAARPQLQQLYAANPPDSNPFDDFDQGFKQGKYKKAQTVRSPVLLFRPPSCLQPEHWQHMHLYRAS
jgi:hypothetical protein